MPDSLPKIPLRMVLIVPFVLLVILAVGLAGYLSFRNGQEAVNNVAHQLHGEITARIEEHLRDFLDMPHRINQLNAAAMRQGWLDVTDAAVLERYFWQQVQTFEAVTSIYFGNTAGGLVDAGREGAEGSLYVIVTDGFVSGTLYKYATDEQGNRGELLVSVPNFDTRTRTWYSRAVERNAATWSDVYVLSTGQDMAIAASRPVYDGQENLLGVVSVDLFVSHLGDFMRDIEIGQTGSAFIVERSGLLVASSTGEKPFVDPPGDEPPRRITASESAMPAIRGAAEYLGAQFGGYERITTSHHLEFDLDGERQFLHVSPFRDGYGIDWLIVVVLPEANFMGQIEANNRATALLIMTALLFVIVVGVVTGRWISEPILHLNASAQALARGDWPQVSGEGDWIAELGELMRSFDDMATRLRQTLESLTAEIAERKRAEALLRHREQEFKTLVEHNPDMIARFDRECRHVYVNPAVEKMFGVPSQAFIGKTHGEQGMAEEQASWAEGIVRRVFDLAEEQTFEVVIDGVEGRRYYMTRGVPEFAADGSVAFALFIHRDVTEQKEAQEEIARLQHLLQNITDSMPSALITLDSSGHVLLWNPSAEALIGRTAEQVAGQLLWQACPELTGYRELVERVMNGEPTARLHRQAVAQGVGTLYHDVDVFPLAADGIDGVVLRVDDVTWRVQLEELMLQSTKMASLGGLAAGLAHEINNPLGAIMQSAQMLELTLDVSRPRTRERLQAHGLDPEQLQHYFQERGLLDYLHGIRTIGRRAAKIVSDLLVFSRRDPVNVRPHNLNVLVGQALDLAAVDYDLARKYDFRDIEIEYELAAGLPPVVCNGQQIQQAILNLVHNAAQAMAQETADSDRQRHSRLTLRTSFQPDKAGEGERVRLEVEDNGPGIPRELQPRLFEPFFTTKEVGEGSGLGLWVCWSIVVERHRGHIWVESSGQHGTCFVVELPVVRWGAEARERGEVEE